MEHVKLHLPSVKYVLLLFACALVLVVMPGMVLLVLFALDVVNAYLKVMFRIYVPVDFFLMLIIFAGYGVSPWLAIIISPFVMLPRMLLGDFEIRHLVKVPILMCVGVACSMMSGLVVVAAGMIAMTLRYALEYGFSLLMTGQLPLGRIAPRIANYLGGYVFLSLFGNMIVGML